MRTYRSTLALLLTLLVACNGPAVGVEPVEPSGLRVLPGVSGLAWVEGDTFLVVHDAKTPDEDDRPRVSLVELTPDAAPVWTPLSVDWPVDGPPSHDLESIARVPGTSTYLLAESGNGGSAHRRIFVVNLDVQRLTIREAVEWPVPVHDVEGTAVVRRGDALYFVFAERAHGDAGTQIFWAPLWLDPLRLGAADSVRFSNPMGEREDARSVAALEIDDRGRVWVASTYDPGRDQGPFRSAIWGVGRFTVRPGGERTVRLHEQPELVATLDGMKVEGFTLDGDGALVVGTDDEDFGGVLRRLPR